MSHHIKGQCRHQITLLPEALDDFVTEDNPVRVIDVFVERLHLDSLGFDRFAAKLTGKSTAILLKLYIYGPPILKLSLILEKTMAKALRMHVRHRFGVLQGYK